MKETLLRGHSSALSSVPIPHPSFSSPWTFTGGLRPAGPKQSPVSFCSLSSLSPDSCRLLTSSTWRQWRERGTGADWCLPICQWRFLPLRPLPFSFFLSRSLVFPPSRPRQSCVFKKPCAHSSLFPATHTDSQSVGRDLLYIDGLI